MARFLQVSGRSMVSIILNTIDRYYLTKYCVGNALMNAGSEFELLVCDNGSEDKRVIEFIESLNPRYFRKNEKNEGNYQMLNHLIKQTEKTDVCVIDNDIALPEGWLAELIRTKDKLKNPGILGLWCVQNFPEVSDGVRRVQRVYGTKYITRAVIDKIGYFCEEYGPYGLGDTDYAVRAEFSDFENAYSPNMTSVHLGHDIGENTVYRKMKSTNLSANHKHLEENINLYKQGIKIYQNEVIDCRTPRR